MSIWLVSESGSVLYLLPRDVTYIFYFEWRRKYTLFNTRVLAQIHNLQPHKNQLVWLFSFKMGQIAFILDFIMLLFKVFTYFIIHLLVYNIIIYMEFMAWHCKQVRTRITYLVSLKNKRYVQLLIMWPEFFIVQPSLENIAQKVYSQ